MSEELKEYPYIDPDAGINDDCRAKLREANKRYYHKNAKKINQKMTEWRRKKREANSE